MFRNVLLSHMRHLSVILTDSHLFIALECEEIIFVLQFACASWLAFKRLDGGYFCLVFKSQSIIGRCPANMKSLAPKVGPLHKALM
jgi:hypothetical protein